MSCSGEWCKIAQILKLIKLIFSWRLLFLKIINPMEIAQTYNLKTSSKNKQ